MRGVGAATSVADGEEFVAGAEGIGDHRGCFGDSADIGGVGEEGSQRAMGDLKIRVERVGNGLRVEMSGRLVGRHGVRIAGEARSAATSGYAGQR